MYKVSLSSTFQKPVFLIKTAFTHKFTFQYSYFITPRWRWHIYLGRHQIWTWSEKCEWALEGQIHRFTVGNHWATGWLWVNSTSCERRDYRQSFVCLHRVEMQGPAVWDLYIVVTITVIKRRTMFVCVYIFILLLTKTLHQIISFLGNLHNMCRAIHNLTLYNLQSSFISRKFLEVLLNLTITVIQVGL